MNGILDNALVDRSVPNWRAIQLASRVPIKILRQSRDYHSNTPDEVLHQMLDSIGIDAICDMVSQGCFLYDVATTLDIPLTKFREWMEAVPQRIQKLEAAEELSAEAYLSLATHAVMTISPGDSDAARVAKIQADHLKWLARVKDHKYSDRVTHNHTGGQSIEYRITMAPSPANNVIDLDQM